MMVSFFPLTLALVPYYSSSHHHCNYSPCFDLSVVYLMVAVALAIEFHVLLAVTSFDCFERQDHNNFCRHFASVCLSTKFCTLFLANYECPNAFPQKCRLFHRLPLR